MKAILRLVSRNSVQCWETDVEVGCNSVLNPGTVLGPNVNVYPTSSVRGYVPAAHIFKTQDQIVKKEA